MKKYLLTLLLIVSSIIVNEQVESSDKLSESKRDSILFDIAKKTVLKYGPDYYEINQPPLIKRIIRKGEHEGRVTWTINEVEQINKE